MKLNEINDKIPLVWVMLQKLLDKKKQVCLVVESIAGVSIGREGFIGFIETDDSEWYTELIIPRMSLPKYIYKLMFWICYILLRYKIPGVSIETRNIPTGW